MPERSYTGRSLASIPIPKLAIPSSFQPSVHYIRSSNTQATKRFGDTSHITPIVMTHPVYLVCAALVPRVGPRPRRKAMTFSAHHPDRPCPRQNRFRCPTPVWGPLTELFTRWGYDVSGWVLDHEHVMAGRLGGGQHYLVIYLALLRGGSGSAPRTSSIFQKAFGLTAHQFDRILLHLTTHESLIDDGVDKGDIQLAVREVGALARGHLPPVVHKGQQGELHHKR